MGSVMLAGVSWAVLLCLRKLALVFTTLAPGDNENKQQLGWDAQAPRTDLAQLRVPAFLPRGSAVQAAGIHPAAKTPTGSRRIAPSKSLKSGNSAAWLSCVQRLLYPLLVHAVQLWFTSLALLSTPACEHLLITHGRKLDRNILAENVCVPRKKANHVQRNVLSYLI